MSTPQIMRMADDDGAFWAIVRDGRIVRRYTSRSSADKALDQMILAARPQRRERPCITCGTAFHSEHAGHRMCSSCRAGGSLCAQFYG